MIVIYLGNALPQCSSGLPDCIAEAFSRAEKPENRAIKFALAPFGVYLASFVAKRAVSSYLAFSPLPFTNSGNLAVIFCGTFRELLHLPVRKQTALWSSDFPQGNLPRHYPHFRIKKERLI